MMGFIHFLEKLESWLCFRSNLTWFNIIQRVLFLLGALKDPENFTICFGSCKDAVLCIAI